MEVNDRRAVVYFRYVAQDEDELNISPGQVHTARLLMIAYTIAEGVALMVYTVIVSVGCPCAWQGRRRMVEGRARGKGRRVSRQLCGTDSTL